MEPEEQGLPQDSGRRKIVKQILEAVDEGSSLVKRRVYFTRPVVIVVLDEVQGRDAAGWSKVCRPDEWDEEKGLEIATARAAQNLADTILSERIGNAT